MNKLYAYVIIWFIGILAVIKLINWMSEPDFNQVIEQNPTAAGEVEKRPSYFRGIDP